MNKTKIPWVRNPDGSQGYSWNIITGCFGPGGTPQDLRRCPYCYAHGLANGRLKTRYLSSDGVHVSYPPPSALDDPFFPRFRPSRLDEPLRVKKPSTIFVCSMGEVFSRYYPSRWLEQILEVVNRSPQHRFLFLTKSPHSIINVSFPHNLWLGVSVNQFIDWDRLSLLQTCKVKHRFVSFEPLLSDVMIGPNRSLLSGLDWVIVGAQTKPYEPPKAIWVCSIVHHATCAGIPVFLKPNLSPCLGDDLRQEFPKDLMRR